MWRKLLFLELSFLEKNYQIFILINLIFLLFIDSENECSRVIRLSYQSLNVVRLYGTADNVFWSKDSYDNARCYHKHHCGDGRHAEGLPTFSMPAKCVGNPSACFHSRNVVF